MEAHAVPLRAHPQPGLLHLLRPKLVGARRRAARERSLARILVLGLSALVFWSLLFGIIHRMLRYFQGTAGIGDVLATKLLGLILLAFLAILLLSNVITALSSFFLARDLELLAAAPVDGLRVYGARLVETAVNSSWMMALVLTPVLMAFGAAYGGGWRFAGVAVLALAAYMTLPAVAGSALTLVLVNVFPARRARDLLALLGLFGVAALVVLFRLLRPEQLMRPEGFRSLADFVVALRTPQSVWLPSEWAAEAILAPLGVGSRIGGPDAFPLLLLCSTAAAAVVVGAWLHGRLYGDGFSRAQESAALAEVRGGRVPPLERMAAGLPVTARSLVVKDVRTFFRDTTQWSQLILLLVLVAVYVYNIRVLPLFSGAEVGFFLVNVIAFLNLGLAGFVLAAIAARFLFPAVSLEGRTLWLLRSSPLDLRALLWSKFWVGVAPLLVLAVVLTVATNLILRVGAFMMALSVGTMVLVTFAMAALALGFGALFPKFDTMNAAEISTGFGGLLFMMTAVAYLAVVVGLEAWPVYAILDARREGLPLAAGHWLALAGGVGGAVALSVAATVVPLAAARRRIARLDP